MRKTQRQPAARETVFGSAKPRESVAISREVKAGRLRRIAPKLYMPEAIVPRNLYAILGPK